MNGLPRTDLVSYARLTCYPPAILKNKKVYPAPLPGIPPLF